MKRYRPLWIIVAIAALSACAANPVVVATRPVTSVMPFEVAAEPERYADAEVIWGGMILGVDNRETQTEVSVLAYPLDSAQRPVPEAGTRGRFIVVLPGYVERHDYPDGLFVTLVGRVNGTRAGQVGEHAYVFPLVEAAHVHRWPPGFQFDRPQWHIGVGIGVRL